MEEKLWDKLETNLHPTLQTKQTYLMIRTARKCSLRLNANKKANKVFEETSVPRSINALFITVSISFSFFSFTYRTPIDLPVFTSRINRNESTTRLNPWKPSTSMLCIYHRRYLLFRHIFRDSIEPNCAIDRFLLCACQISELNRHFIFRKLSF